MMKVVLCFCLLLLFLFSRSIEATQNSKIKFQTLPNSSSTSACDRASRNGSKNRASSSSSSSSLRLELVFHRHGDDSSSLADNILMKDQLRVQSIHARDQGNQPTTTTLPARSGLHLGSANFIVTIGLGTPAQNLTLMFDTGSDVTWTQCGPCSHCYKQNDTMFSHWRSFTYEKILCKSTSCADLGSDKDGGRGCPPKKDSECIYKVIYLDKSYSVGTFSTERLTLKSDLIPNFQFGCGHNNSDIAFGELAGLLGLGRGPASLVSQTAHKYSRVFSYCLTTASKGGYLSFGAGGRPYRKGMSYTPLVPAPRRGMLPSYYIEITSIRVGGTNNKDPLPIPESVFTTAGTMIDSGTVITRLPPAAYKVLSKEFTRVMTSSRYNYKVAHSYHDLLDTCFYITIKDRVPAIFFTFKGRATISLSRPGVVFFMDEEVSCLAFAPNEKPTDLAIFGNSQQMNLEVMYDVLKLQLRFFTNMGCK